MAEYYQIAVLPPRVRKPRDKGHAKNGVQYAPASTGWRVSKKITSNSIHAEHLMYNYHTGTFFPSVCAMLRFTV
jgi:hypothetical protein